MGSEAVVQTLWESGLEFQVDRALRNSLAVGQLRLLPGLRLFSGFPLLSFVGLPLFFRTGLFLGLLLKHGVLGHFAVNDFDEFQVGEGKQLDGLLEGWG